MQRSVLSRIVVAAGAATASLCAAQHPSVGPQAAALLGRSASAASEHAGLRGPASFGTVASCKAAEGGSGFEDAHRAFRVPDWSTAFNPQGPIAGRVPVVTELFGDVRVNNFDWLRDDDRKDPRVLALCDAENKHVKASLGDTDALQETLFTEMKGRIKEADSRTPLRDAAYYYYTRTEEGKQYSIRCRRKLKKDGAHTASAEMNDSTCFPEEVLLDENVEATQSEYFVVRGFAVSPDHDRLVYGVDRAGDEKYSLKVLDLTAKGGPVPLAEEIPNTSGGIAWSSDNKNFWYSTRDPKLARTDKVWRHTIGTAVSEDQLVFHEKDDGYFLGISRSRSGEYVYINNGSSETSDLRVLDASKPGSKPVPLLPKKKGVEISSVEDRKGVFFVLSNEEAVNSKLVAVRLGGKPRELIRHDPAVRLEDVIALEDHLIVLERVRGLQQIAVYDFTDDSGSIGNRRVVRMPEEAYSLGMGWSPFGSDVLRYHYTSMTTPASTFDLDIKAMAASGSAAVLKKQQPVLGGFRSEDYVSKRIFAKSHDGVEVPISIVHRKDVQLPAPTLVDGYGAYEISNDPYFSSARLSLLDRGVVFAVAHVRGGGEMGRQWYEDGKYCKKRNTALDFIACSQALIDRGLADVDNVCIEGASAGGIVVGQSLNDAPQRADGKPFFAGAAGVVPFVDVLTTMLDPTIPLTVPEYEEWGNPQEEKYYRYIKTYSPIDNVSPHQAYPPVLLTAGLHDPRVGYWEVLKYAQALRAGGAPTVLCKVDMAGHFSKSGRFDRLREVATKYAFFLKVWGKHAGKAADK